MSTSTSHLSYLAKPGPARRFEFEDEFFLTLVKLKNGKFNIDLAREMGVSSTAKKFTHVENTLEMRLSLRLLFEMKVNLDDPDMIAPFYHQYKSLKGIAT